MTLPRSRATSGTRRCARARRGAALVVLVHARAARDVSVVYLILYPGVGTVRAAHCAGRSARDSKRASRITTTRSGHERERIAQTPIADLQRDADRDAVRLARVQQQLHRVPRAGRARPGLAVPESHRRRTGSGAATRRSSRRRSLQGRTAVMPPWQTVLERRRRREDGGLRARAREAHRATRGRRGATVPDLLQRVPRRKRRGPAGARRARAQR